jgi:hypothetical protein
MNRAQKRAFLAKILLKLRTIPLLFKFYSYLISQRLILQEISKKVQRETGAERWKKSASRRKIHFN